MCSYQGQFGHRHYFCGKNVLKGKKKVLGEGSEYVID